MIKNLLGMFLLLLLGFTNIFAQHDFRIGGNFNVVIPIGDFSDITNTGIGGTLQTDYSISETFALTLSSSYLSLPIDIPTIGIDGKSIDFSTTAYNILLGGKHFFTSSLFAFAQAGIAFWKLNLNYFDSPSNDINNISTDYYSCFSAFIGGGYKYNLAKNKSDVELSAGYNFTNGDEINYNTFTISAGLYIYL